MPRFVDKGGAGNIPDAMAALALVRALTAEMMKSGMLRPQDIEHIKDYPNARKAPWEYPHRGGRTHAMEEAYPVLKRDYPLNEKNLDWWVNEKESPYTEVKRFGADLRAALSGPGAAGSDR